MKTALVKIEKHIFNKMGQTIAFTVPNGVNSIAISVQMKTPTWLTYMVYDVTKTLRAQYQNGETPQPIIIHKEKSKTSPYTIYGNLPQGEWNIELGLDPKKDLDDEAIIGKLTIAFNQENNANEPDQLSWQTEGSPLFQLGQLDRQKQYQSAHKWYKGDFHTHTIYSDGKMTREENMGSAKNQGLDFFVATDHNVVPTSWHEEGEIVVIPGVEVTSPLGHFNVLATNTSPFSKNTLADMITEDGMNKIIETDYGDALISINHPFLTEWKWLFTETPLNKIDTIEICNDPTYPANEKATKIALAAWNILLNDGYNITGIGGSDSHFKPTETYEGSTEPSLIGDPGTFVYCEGLNIDHIVRGLRKGNVTVSRGERIEFTIGDTLPGETIHLPSGTAKASVQTDTPLCFEWIVDGILVKSEMGNESTYDFQWENGDYHWIRIDVKDQDGHFYGFSNPIYFGKKQPTLQKWGELLDIMKDTMQI